MTDPGCALLVFARAPVPGRVKTRLIPAVGGEEAARIHMELVRRTLRTATALMPVELCCAPDAGHPFFEDCARDFGVTLRGQSGADLGERMQHAIDEALRRCRGAIVIGCDCPELAAADLDAAARLLEHEADVVLGPAEDGGYYLVGLGRPCAALFEGVQWGSGTVLARTRANAAALGLRLRELPMRWDVDRPEDLRRYRRLDG
jgi:rSAM/selenodomain-associated transferase 1